MALTQTIDELDGSFFHPPLELLLPKEAETLPFFGRGDVSITSWEW